MKPKRNYVPGHLDDCQTPGYALTPLFSYISFSYPQIRKPRATIWECACGEGYLLKELHRLGYSAIGTDLISGFDFLEENPSFDFSCIITNPPYSRKYEFIARCYEIGKPWALLMPCETMGAGKAQELFNKYGIGIIYFSPGKRVRFKMPNIGWEKYYIGKDGKQKKHTAQFPVAWFTWNMGILGNRFYDASHWTDEYVEKFECEITDL